jgi:ribosomal protein S12 methylthiotransferase
MADGLILPYLDIPFQHSHPGVLKRMARPANQVKTLNEIEAWREICPDITLRSTFIVGYPGETEEEFSHLLEWLKEAKLDRVGCFKYENVAGAQSNNLTAQCSEDIKHDRWRRFMATAQKISEEKLNRKIGSIQEVIVDQADSEGAVCRTKGDAPEIDGNLFIDSNFSHLKQGDILSVKVDEASEYDLWGSTTIN